jgi:hypothetical protein
MTRLRLGLDKGPSAAAKKAPRGQAPPEAEPGDDPRSSAVFDSPYLAKILDKLGG